MQLHLKLSTVFHQQTKETVAACCSTLMLVPGLPSSVEQLDSYVTIFGVIARRNQISSLIVSGDFHSNNRRGGREMHGLHKSHPALCCFHCLSGAWRLRTSGFGCLCLAFVQQTATCGVTEFPRYTHTNLFSFCSPSWPGCFTNQLKGKH